MEIDIEQELQILKSEYNTLKKELKNRIPWMKSFQIYQKAACTGCQQGNHEQNVARHTDGAGHHRNLPIYELPDAVRGTGIAVGTGRPGCWLVDQPETGDERSAERRCADGDEKIAGYRKYYDRLLLASLLPVVVMLTYIFLHLYARADNPAAIRAITVSGIVFIVLGIIIVLFQYKKHVQRCKELLEQFEEWYNS